MSDGTKYLETEQISDKQNMSALSEDEALNFINDNLKRNYESIAKLKNGRGLGNLLENVSGYSVNAKCWWEDIRDILIMLDKEKDISITELKCGNEEEIIKFISWLKFVKENY